MPNDKKKLDQLNDDILINFANKLGYNGEDKIKKLNEKIASGDVKAVEQKQKLLKNATTVFNAEQVLQNKPNDQVPSNVYDPLKSIPIDKTTTAGKQSGVDAFLSSTWNSFGVSILKGLTELPSATLNTTNFIAQKVDPNTDFKIDTSWLDKKTDAITNWMDNNISAYVDDIHNRGGISYNDNTKKYEFDLNIGPGTFGNLLGGVASFLVPTWAAKLGKLGKFSQIAAGFTGGAAAQASAMFDIAKENGMLKNEEDRKRVSTLIFATTPIISLIDMFTGAEAMFGRQTVNKLAGKTLMDSLMNIGEKGLTKETFGEAINTTARGFLQTLKDEGLNKKALATATFDFLKTPVKGFVEEGLTEGLQSAIEKGAYQIYDRNYAEPNQRTQYDQDLYDGNGFLGLNKKQFADVLNEGFLGGLMGGGMGILHKVGANSELNETIYNWADRQLKSGKSTDEVLQTVSNVLDNSKYFAQPFKDKKTGKTVGNGPNAMTNGEQIFNDVNNIVQSIQDFNEIGVINNTDARYQAFSLGMMKANIDADVSGYNSQLKSIDDQIAQVQQEEPDNISKLTSLSVSKSRIQSDQPRIDHLKGQSSLIQDTLQNIGLNDAPDNTFDQKMNVLDAKFNNVQNNTSQNVTRETLSNTSTVNLDENAGQKAGQEIGQKLTSGQIQLDFGTNTQVNTPETSLPQDVPGPVEETNTSAAVEELPQNNTVTLEELQQQEETPKNKPTVRIEDFEKTKPKKNKPILSDVFKRNMVDLHNALNDGRKKNDIFDDLSVTPIDIGKGVKRFILESTHVKDKSIVYNLLDENGNIPEGEPANWRDASNLKHSINSQIEAINNLPKKDKDVEEKQKLVKSIVQEILKPKRSTKKEPNQNPTTKKEKRAKRDSVIDDKLSSLLDDFVTAVGAIKKIDGDGPNANALATGIKLVTAFTEKGVYKISDIFEDIFDKLGESALNLLPHLKDAYNAVRGRADKSIRKNFNTEDEVFDYEAPNDNEPINNTENIDKPIKNNEIVNDNNSSENESTKNTDEYSGIRSTSEKSSRGINTDRNELDTTSNGELSDVSQGDGSIRQTGTDSNKTSKQLPGKSGDVQVDGLSRGRSSGTGKGTVISITEPISSNYVIPVSNEKDVFNPKRRFDDNLTALRTLESIISEKRNATGEEQEILSKYVGWGGLKVVLLGENDKWSQSDEQHRGQVSELNEIIDKLESYGIKNIKASIKASTANAHFTAIPIIRSVYNAINGFGFTGGKILEPSAGIGNFLGAMPKNISSNSQLTSVEIDKLTGEILKRLYPNSSTNIAGLQEANLPNNYYDLIISNVPFGNYSVFDKSFTDPVLKRSAQKIHTYFFAKAIQQAKEGGLIAFVTSSGLMDSTGNKFIRQYLNENAEFLGAIRLPNTAFTGNANTEVVTDVIFLKKNTGNTENTNSFVETGKLQVKHKNTGEDKIIEVNQYFIENPDHAIGEFKAGGLYTDDEMTLIAPKSIDISKEMNKIITEKFPTNIYVKRQDSKVEKEIAASTNNENIPEREIYIDNGKAFQKLLFGESKEIAKTHSIKKIEQFIKLREALKKQYSLESQSGSTSQEIEANRKKLDNEYETFVKSFGSLNSKKNVSLLNQDINGFNMLSLESYNKKTKDVKKADIFSKRVIQAREYKTTAANIEDALHISINESGYINIDRVAHLLSSDPDKVINEHYGTIFLDSDGKVVTRDDYLSGNVKKKLAEAIELAKTNDIYNSNIAELEKVIPADIPSVNIEVNIGARWVPTKYYQDFVNDILKTDSQVAFIASSDTYVIKAETTVESREKYGTKRIHAYKLLEQAMHGQSPIIKDKVSENPDKYVVNKDDTQKAQEKQNELIDAFNNWIWKDAERRKTLGEIYNAKFNTTIKRKFDGSYLQFDGINNIELKPHQKDADAMLIHNNGGIIDHIVGAGKTYVMISTAMKMKQMGIANKPTIAGLKSTIPDLVNDAKKAYPNAKILSPSTSDFSSKKRKQFLANIQNNDWDLIILSHEQFTAIPQDNEMLIETINSELEMLEQEIEQIRIAGGEVSKSVLKGLETRKLNLTSKLNELMNLPKDVEILNFKQIGIDHLMVDESQMFKNLEYSTKINKVAGLGNKLGSKRSFNMLTAVRTLQKLNGGDKGVTFLSGTPISNSLVEMYLLFKYLRPQKMDELGYKTFDSWIKQFAVQSNELEFAVTGSVQQKTRFREFINVPELSMLYNEIADIRNDDNLSLPKPKIKNGGPQLVLVKQSPYQEEWTKKLIEFAKQTHGDRDGNLIGKGDLTDAQQSAAMLLVTNLSSKLSIDMRLIDRNAEDNPTGKLSVASKNVAEIYNRTTDIKGAQIIFCDTGTPKSKNVVENLKNYLEDELNIAPDDITQIFGEQDAKLPTLPRTRELLAEVLDYDDKRIDYVIQEAISSQNQFNVYDEIKRKLINQGVPAEQIAFIHDYNTKVARMDLFDAIKEGDIRIVIGSTQKLGTGTNIQRRLVALHHIDAQWNPAAMEQRNGRGVRQGNLNAEIEIYNYGTELTLDAYKYQLIATKQKFIDQVKNGALAGERSIKEDDGEEMSSQSFVAQLSGNPLLLEKAKIDALVDKLKKSKRNHDAEIYDAASKYDKLLANIPNIEHEIERRKKDIKTVIDNGTIENQRIRTNAIIDGVKAENAKQLGEMIIAKTKLLTKKVIGHTEVIGKVNGLDILGTTIQGTDMYGRYNNSVDVELRLSGDLGYHLTKSVDPTAQGTAVANTINKLSDYLEGKEEDLKRTKSNLIKYDELSKGTWEKQAEFDAAMNKQKDITKQLNDQVKEEEENYKKSKGIENDTEAVPDGKIREGNIIYPMHNDQAIISFVKGVKTDTNEDIFLIRINKQYDRKIYTSTIVPMINEYNGEWNSSTKNIVFYDKENATNFFDTFIGNFNVDNNETFKDLSYEQEKRNAGNTRRNDANADTNTNEDNDTEADEDVRYQRQVSVANQLAKTINERLQATDGFGKDIKDRKYSEPDTENTTEPNVETKNIKLSSGQVRIINKILNKVFPNIEFISNAENYNDILSKVRNAGDFEFISSGFIYNGKLYINPENTQSSTQIHEVLHIVTSWSAKYAPATYDKIISAAQEAPEEVIQYVEDLYPELDSTSEAFWEEVFTTFAGERLAPEVEKLLQKEENKKWYNSIIDAIKEFINSVKQYVADQFDIDMEALPENEFLDMSLVDFTDFIGKQLLGSKKISDITSAEIDQIQKLRNELKQNEYFGMDSQVSDSLITARQMLKDGHLIDDIISATGWEINPTTGNWQNNGKVQFQSISNPFVDSLTNNDIRFQKTARDVAKVNNKFALENIETSIASRYTLNPNNLTGDIRNFFDEYIKPIANATNFRGLNVIDQNVISTYNNDDALHEMAQLFFDKQADVSAGVRDLYNRLFTTDNNSVINIFNRWLKEGNFTELEVEPNGEVQQVPTEFDDKNDTTEIVNEKDKLSNNKSGILSKIFDTKIAGKKLSSRLVENKLFNLTFNMKTIGMLFGKEGSTLNRLLVDVVEKSRDIAAPYKVMARNFENQLVNKYKNLSSWMTGSNISNVEKIKVNDTKGTEYEFTVGEVIAIIHSAQTQASAGMQKLSITGSKVKFENFRDIGDIEFTLTEDELLRITEIIENNALYKEFSDNILGYYNNDQYIDSFGNPDPGKKSLFSMVQNIFEIDQGKPLSKQNIYVPLLTYENNKRLNEAKNLKDSEQLLNEVSILHERTQEAAPLVLKDAIQTLHDYNRKSNNFIENWIPVRNLSIFLIRNEQWFRNNNLQYVHDAILNHIQNLNDFDKLEFEANKSMISQVSNKLRSGFVVSRLSLNMFTALKQFWGYPIGLGLGIVEDKYLMKQMSTVVKDMGISYGALVREFLNYVAGKEVTNIASEKPYVDKIANNKYAYQILDRITDSNLYNMNDIVTDALGAGSQSESKANLYWSKFLNFFKTVGMSQIKQADIAVIIGMYNAAEAQVLDTMPYLSEDEQQKEIARLATEIMYQTQQTNTLSDKTQLQLSHDVVSKQFTTFTSQTQKMQNTVLQKYAQYAKEDDPDLKMLYGKQFNSAVTTMYIGNAFYMSLITTLASILRGKSSDKDDDQQFAETFKWNFLRELAQFNPSFIGEIGAVGVSYMDNQNWSDEVGGLNVYSGVTEAVAGTIKAVNASFSDASEEKRDKQIKIGVDKMITGIADIAGVSQELIRQLKD